MKTKPKPPPALVNSPRPGNHVLLFRWLILFLLLGAAVCFAFYAGTGQARYKRWGWVILKWTLIAAFGFFTVLILERVG